MSIDAAIVGVAELAPRRQSVDETTLGLIAKVSIAALRDAQMEPGAIDGLFVGVQVGKPLSMCRRRLPNIWVFSLQWQVWLTSEGPPPLVWHGALLPQFLQACVRRRCVYSLIHVKKPSPDRRIVTPFASSTCLSEPRVPTSAMPCWLHGICTNTEPLPSNWPGPWSCSAIMRNSIRMLFP